MRNLLLQSKKEQVEVRIARGESEETVQITTQKSPYGYRNPIENGLILYRLSDVALNHM